MSDIITPFVIEGQEYILRFPGLVQISIKKEAHKLLGLKDPVNLSGLLQIAASGDVEAQSYLLWQAIRGGNPDLRSMKFEFAVELRDKYLTSGDLDDGSKYKTLLELLADTVDAAAGASRKEAQARMKVDEEKNRIEQIKRTKRLQKQALTELKQEETETEEEEETGTGLDLPSSALVL